MNQARRGPQPWPGAVALPSAIDRGSTRTAARRGGAQADRARLDRRLRLLLRGRRHRPGGRRSVDGSPHIHGPAAGLDQLVGALACAAVWLRRRWPVGLAIAMVPVSLVSDTASGAAAVALFTLAVHRPFRYVAWIGGVSIAIVPLMYWLRPDRRPAVPGRRHPRRAVSASVIGWGMFVRSRRQLLLSLRDRARRAETEAALRAEQAQRLAREAIAREMHDVLAHRLTLLSVHAGALEFRPDAPREEVARAAGVIRESAHEALQDLREIIGVLRAATARTRAAPSRPSPPWTRWSRSPARRA